MKGVNTGMGDSSGAENSTTKNVDSDLISSQRNRKGMYKPAAAWFTIQDPSK
jgi:hypothetical protein